MATPSSATRCRARSRTGSSNCSTSKRSARRFSRKSCSTRNTSRARTEIRVSLEALPEVPEPKIADLKLERLTVDADESLVDDQLKQLATSTKNWVDAPKK